MMVFIDFFARYIIILIGYLYPLPRNIFDERRTLDEEIFGSRNGSFDLRRRGSDCRLFTQRHLQRRWVWWLVSQLPQSPVDYKTVSTACFLFEKGIASFSQKEKLSHGGLAKGILFLLSCDRGVHTSIPTWCKQIAYLPSPHRMPPPERVFPLPKRYGSRHTASRNGMRFCQCEILLRRPKNI